ncbi:hypothetical protein [Streptomyces camelliae]|uniref:Uncharacterized protein n=1 Tax=Streptomyces camelliae TaxID=3004093 RepID=A0ABY7NYH2_9ACTN|nr:hypothetical protein [Streptomyces sp. HUAS 2-6]WBO61631.1 hypothetical protein O1G22_01495 [Streptomyces sp. HUAS 2-6]
MPPTSGTVTGDVDPDFHDQLRPDKGDVEGLAGAPPHPAEKVQPVQG